MVAEWWRSGGGVVAEWWRSGGGVVAEWWRSGGGVVAEWWRSGGGVVAERSHQSALEMCNLPWTPHSSLEKDNSLNHSCVSPKMGCLEYTQLRTKDTIK